MLKEHSKMARRVRETTHRSWEISEAVVNLFQAEVDKLTVIDGEEIVLEEVRIPTGNSMGGCPVVQSIKEVDITATLDKQLQHTKKQLLGEV